MVASDADRPRFLVVDDDTTTCVLLASLLAPAGRSVAAHTAVEAASALRESAVAGTPFRIAFIDIGLPDRSGLSLIEEVRAAGDLRTDFVVITASADPEHIRRAYGSRAAGYIVKPIDVDVLARLLAALGVSLPGVRASRNAPVRGSGAGSGP